LPKSLKKVLRFKGRRRKPKNEEEKRGKLLDTTSIHDRPECVETRSRIGDWESDTVHGKRNTGAFATHVDRKSGFLLTSKLDAATSEAFSASTIQVFGALPQAARCSLTADRGKEFSQHLSLSSSLGMPVFFCDPSSPWQRGSNENTNGLLRQFFPKGSSFATVSHTDLASATDLINDRPRKRLNWLSPRDVFFDSLLHLA
jgi:IS30 family transposase